MNFTISHVVPVIFGEDTYLQIGKKLKENGVAKVLCIYDKGVKLAGVVDKIIQTVEAEGIKVIGFDGVQPDPPDTIVDEAGELGRKEGVDAILGIGGGSSLDAAKAVNILLGNPGSITRYFDFSVPQNLGKPLFLIPTTSGTGAEVTSIAVLTNTSSNKKQGVGGKNCVATLAIVDPTLTLGLPPHITAATGMDTFAHAVEAYTSIMNNPMSDILALETISLVVNYLPIAVKDGSNITARSKMSFACTAAGMSFGDAFPHLGHAIGHTIGARHHVPHGTACGLAIPGVIEYVSDIIPDRVRAIGKAMGLELVDDISNEKLGTAVSDMVRKLNKEIGLPTLKELKITESDLSIIATETLGDVCARLIPKKTTSEDVLKLLEKEYAQ